MKEGRLIDVHRTSPGPTAKVGCVPAGNFRLALEAFYATQLARAGHTDRLVTGNVMATRWHGVDFEFVALEVPRT